MALENWEIPEGHPEVDWSLWRPAGKTDVRCPCPALNALANHHVLPHSGKHISKMMVYHALRRAFNFEHLVANFFAHSAVGANENHEVDWFNLDQLSNHDYIEHDVSLSREDIAFGSNSAFNKHKFHMFLKSLGSPENGYEAWDAEASTSWESMTHARYARVLESKAKHDKEGKEWGYGLKEALTSYNESAGLLNVLGKEGVVPIAWLKVLFEHERFPYEEGWRPPPIVNAGMQKHAIFQMLIANEHKFDEAELVGMGTYQAMSAAFKSLVSGPTPEVLTGTVAA